MKISLGEGGGRKTEVKGDEKEEEVGKEGRDESISLFPTLLVRYV